MQVYTAVETPEVSASDEVDDMDRDAACAKALMQPSLDTVYARIDADPAAHYLTKVCLQYRVLLMFSVTLASQVYTNHKEAPAPGSRRRPPVDEPVSLFQSTRNNKRHVHALLFLRRRHGPGRPIGDTELKTVWRHLENTCGHGIHHRTGHATGQSGSVCVNPYHYRWVEASSLAGPSSQRRIRSNSK